MLSEQLPPDEKIGFKAEVSPNVTNTGESSADHLTLSDRIARLLAVEKHVKADELVGTIDHPEQWIAGEGMAIASQIKENAESIFYFVRTPLTYLALGGSAAHLIGARPTRKSAFGLSYASWLLRNLAEIDRAPRLFFNRDADMASYAEIAVSGDHPWGYMICNQCAYRRNGTFNLPIRFLARRILKDTVDGKQVVLASPLYVEQV